MTLINEQNSECRKLTAVDQQSVNRCHIWCDLWRAHVRLLKPMSHLSSRKKTFMILHLETIPFKDLWKFTLHVTKISFPGPKVSFTLQSALVMTFIGFIDLSTHLQQPSAWVAESAAGQWRVYRLSNNMRRVCLCSVHHSVWTFKKLEFLLFTWKPSFYKWDLTRKTLWKNK